MIGKETRRKRCSQDKAEAAENTAPVAGILSQWGEVLIAFGQARFVCSDPLGGVYPPSSSGSITRVS